MCRDVVDSKGPDHALVTERAVPQWMGLPKRQVIEVPNDLPRVGTLRDLRQDHALLALEPGRVETRVAEHVGQDFKARAVVPCACDNAKRQVVFDRLALDPASQVLDHGVQFLAAAGRRAPEERVLQAVGDAMPFAIPPAACFDEDLAGNRRRARPADHEHAQPVGNGGRCKRVPVRKHM